jgi:hypothetical protein
MMGKKFKPCNRDQMFLLPRFLEEWLPEDRLAYFIIKKVEKLDLAAIYASYRGDGRGLRQLLLRGLAKVAAEWDLWCLSHNLLKLYRFGGLPAD